MFSAPVFADVLFVKRSVPYRKKDPKNVTKCLKTLITQKHVIKYKYACVRVYIENYSAPAQITNDSKKLV